MPKFERRFINSSISIIPYYLQVGYNHILGVSFKNEERPVNTNQERAIDVPDNFVENKKTPPRYPLKVKTNQQHAVKEEQTN